MERGLEILFFEEGLKEPVLEALMRKWNHCFHILERLFFGRKKSTCFSVWFKRHNQNPVCG